MKKTPPWILVEVMGVGYDLQLSMNSFYLLPPVEQEVTLYTHLMVREDHHALYGFYSKEEREMFQEIIKISGLGAKAALALLSGLSLHALKSAILNEEIALLKKIPGIGPKTAQRLVVELQDKKKKWRGSEMTTVLAAHRTVALESPEQQAIEALMSLGYKLKEAQGAIERIKTSSLSCEEIIKSALQGLAKG